MIWCKDKLLVLVYKEEMSLDVALSRAEVFVYLKFIQAFLNFSRFIFSLSEKFMKTGLRFQKVTNCPIFFGVSFDFRNLM